MHCSILTLLYTAYAWQSTSLSTPSIHRMILNCDAYQSHWRIRFALYSIAALYLDSPTLLILDVLAYPTVVVIPISCLVSQNAVPRIKHSSLLPGIADLRAVALSWFHSHAFVTPVRYFVCARLSKNHASAMNSVPRSYLRLYLHLYC